MKFTELDFCICGPMPWLSLLLVSYMKAEFTFPLQLSYVLLAKSLEDEHMI